MDADTDAVGPGLVCLSRLGSIRRLGTSSTMSPTASPWGVVSHVVTVYDTLDSPEISSCFVRLSTSAGGGGGLQSTRPRD